MRLAKMVFWLGLVGCGPAFQGAIEPEAAHCRATNHPVEWRVPADGATRAELDRWCRAVGPPLLEQAAVPDTLGIDSLLFVTWNAHVGGGDLNGLVEAVRAGRLTGGKPVRHFVILLQEVFREDDSIPPLTQDMAYPGLIEGEPLGGTRTDIEAWAEANPAVSVFYAPSMRNGAANAAGSHEDRGNALISTLPLLEPTAYEMPVQRQRRVAAGAFIEGRTRDGEDWRMHVVSVHLENRPAGMKNPERARLEQTEWLLSVLPEADNAVLGGDLNTWLRGPEEINIVRVAERYPDTPAQPAGPTYEQVGVLRMHLDYLFFRLADADARDYRRLPSQHGSDHYPLLAWVVFK